MELWIAVYSPASEEIMLYSLEGFLCSEDEGEEAVFVWHKTVDCRRGGGKKRFELFDGPFFVLLEEHRSPESVAANISCDCWWMVRSASSTEHECKHIECVKNVACNILGESISVLHGCCQLKSFVLPDGNCGIAMFAPQRVQTSQGVVVQFAPLFSVKTLDENDEVLAELCGCQWDQENWRWNLPFELLWKRTEVIRALWHMDEHDLAMGCSSAGVTFAPPSNMVSVLVDGSVIVLLGDAPVYEVRKNAFITSRDPSLIKPIMVECFDEGNFFLVSRGSGQLWAVSSTGEHPIPGFSSCCSSVVFSWNAIYCLKSGTPTTVVCHSISDILSLPKLHKERERQKMEDGPPQAAVLDSLQEAAAKSEAKTDLLLDQVDHLSSLISRLSSVIRAQHPAQPVKPSGTYPACSIFITVVQPKRQQQLPKMIVSPGVTAVRVDTKPDIATWLVSSVEPISSDSLEAICSLFRDIFDASSVNPSTVITSEMLNHFTSIEKSISSVQEVLRRRPPGSPSLSPQEFSSLLLTVSDALSSCSEILSKFPKNLFMTSE